MRLFGGNSILNDDFFVNDDRPFRRTAHAAHEGFDDRELRPQVFKQGADAFLDLCAKDFARLLGFERDDIQTVSIEKSCWLTPMTLACILLMLAFVSCFLMQRPLSLLLLAVQLVLGLTVTYLIVFSALPNTSFSWLIVPLNPLPLLFWRWRRWWLLPFALVCIGWSFAMLTRIGNPLVDNAYIVLALALAVNYIGQWKRFINK